MTGPNGARDVGTGKQLFFDERFVETIEGLTRTVNPPLSRTPVDLPSVPGLHPIFYLTVLDIDGRLWMYYHMQPRQTHQPHHQRQMCCLAHSDDGIDWEPAAADRFEVAGSRRNNVVMPGAVGTPFLDPHETAGCRFWFAGTLGERTEPPFWEEARGTYYGRFGDGRGVHGAVYLLNSRDGITWRRVPDGVVVPFRCDTQNQVVYDAGTGVYAAYLRGQAADGPGWRTVARVTSPGLTDLPFDFRTDARLPVSPAGLYGPMPPPCAPVVMAGDERDPPATDIYTPCVNPYPWAEDVCFAFPAVYRHYDGQETHGRDHRGQHRNDGSLEVQLAVSRDGVGFDRFRTPYVGPGPMEEPRLGGRVYMGVGLIRRGSFVYQYYAEGACTHGLMDWDVRFWLAKQRLDGFVSVDAGPCGGHVVTPPVVFGGSRLLLNVDCGAMGEAWVELQDEHGKPLPGFTRSEAVSVDRNGVAQEVWWRGGPDVGWLTGRPVKLRISMRSAKLYAFRFAETC